MAGSFIHWDNIFKCNFPKEFLLYFNANFIKSIPNGQMLKISPRVSIDSSNGLALNRWQAMTWTNDDPVYLCLNV